jgi:NAD(P)H-quinone oxidoreductase subunit 5
MMLEPTTIMRVLALVVIVAPAALLCALGLPSLVDRPLSEARIARFARWSVTIALLAAVGVFVGMLITGDRHFPLDLGKWVSVGNPDAGGTGTTPGHAPHYSFTIKFVFDRLSVPFLILALVLCGTVAHFATKYLHRERGYNRFFVLYAVFVLGMVVATLAGTIETLFAGWEFVGLSSALLVAFFQERPAPVRNGLWVWAVYRTTDVSLVLAAIAIHVYTGGGDFDNFLVGEGWPYEGARLVGSQPLVIGLLLLGAAIGKSALVPLSGWLPRAMEGPTPSSAVFYGALSVHFGAYLLLRATPLLEASEALAVIVIAFGLATALFAYLAGTVQTDIKSALSFASLTQVGIIVAEIGFGRWEPFLWYVALVHLLGHACLRTLQFLRAPTLLQDYRHLEDALGSRLNHGTAFWVRVSPMKLRGWLYRFALERGYLDAIIMRFMIRPFVVLFRWFDATERRVTNQLNGVNPPDASPAPAANAAPAPVVPVASPPAAPTPTAPLILTTEPSAMPAERHA